MPRRVPEPPRRPTAGHVRQSHPQRIRPRRGEPEDAAVWARPWAYTQVRYGSEPTEREIETLAAVVRHSTLAAAAHALGIKRSTAGHLLGLLYARIGARDRSNAVYLLYRKYGDRFEF